MREAADNWREFFRQRFPFLFGGTFIEGPTGGEATHPVRDFPSFSEGLSLRADLLFGAAGRLQFPFLFGGTFIEGVVIHSVEFLFRYFPSFSEGLSLRAKFAGVRRAVVNFPSFSEGLSLRVPRVERQPTRCGISLPFRRDFH